MERDFSILIVHWKTRDLLPGCLASIEKQTGVTWETWVLDNEGDPWFGLGLQQAFPWAKVVSFSSNLGFGRACNRVLPLCTGRLLYFVNPDTVLLGSEVLASIHKFMLENPRVGIASTCLTDMKGQEQPVASPRYPGEKYAAPFSDRLPGPIAMVLGASMVVRRELFEALGGFDEDFFVYGEDFDLCLRARKEGWEIGVVPKARVLHRGGGSERDRSPREVWDRKLRAEYLFYSKHYSPDVIARIRQAHRWKAAWELFLLGISWGLSWGRKKSRWQWRHAKYRAIWRWAHRKFPSG